MSLVICPLMYVPTLPQLNPPSPALTQAPRRLSAFTLLPLGQNPSASFHSFPRLPPVKPRRQGPVFARSYKTRAFPVPLLPSFTPLSTSGQPAAYSRMVVSEAVGSACLQVFVGSDISSIQVTDAFSLCYLSSVKMQSVVWGYVTSSCYAIAAAAVRAEVLARGLFPWSVTGPLEQGHFGVWLLY